MDFVGFQGDQRVRRMRALMQAAVSRRPLRKVLKRCPLVASGVFVAEHETRFGLGRHGVTHFSKSRPGHLTPRVAFRIARSTTIEVLKQFQIFQQRAGVQASPHSAPRLKGRRRTLQATKEAQIHSRSPCFGGAAPSRSSDNNNTILGRQQKQCRTVA